MLKKIALAIILISSFTTYSKEVKAKDTEKISNIITNLIKEDNNFVHSHSKKYFDTIKEHQHPNITLLTCSDSRVQENILEKDPINKIFSVRNIGNQLATGTGSVDYGIKNLHTQLLIIMGHSHCGAIKAAMSNYQEESFSIIEDIDHLTIPVSKINKDSHSKNFELDWAKSVEKNVDYQVTLANKQYESEVKSGKLIILGIVDDFTNIYGSGEGRTILVNINNITELNKIKNHLILKDISKDLKNLIIKRLN
jgi:carbonic anhydrase